MLLHSILIYVSANILAVKSDFIPSRESVSNIDNRDELKSIIKSLNDINEDLKANKQYDKISSVNTEELNDEEKEEKLQKIVWLIKNNYNAKTHHDFIKSPLNSGARLYFIKNPEVIEDYKKYLQGKKITSSKKNLLSENGYRKQSSKKKLNELRRQITFRLNAASKDRSGHIHKQNLEDRTLNEEERDIRLDTLENDKQVNTYEDIQEKAVRKVPVDSLQLYIKERKDRHFGREKKWEDEKSREDERRIEEHWNTERANDRNRSKDYKNSWEVSKKTGESSGIKYTTKYWTVREFKRKRLDADDKLSYGKQSGNLRGDFAFYGRTSIPYVGKKGIFEDD